LLLTVHPPEELGEEEPHKKRARERERGREKFINPASIGRIHQRLPPTMAHNSNGDICSTINNCMHDDDANHRSEPSSSDDESGDDVATATKSPTAAAVMKTGQSRAALNFRPHAHPLCGITRGRCIPPSLSSDNGAAAAAVEAQQHHELV
jgi:hypothetical protein